SFGLVVDEELRALEHDAVSLGRCEGKRDDDAGLRSTDLSLSAHRVAQPGGRDARVVGCDRAVSAAAPERRHRRPHRRASRGCHAALRPAGDRRAPGGEPGPALKPEPDRSAGNGNKWWRWWELNPRAPDLRAPRLPM